MTTQNTCFTYAMSLQDMVAVAQYAWVHELITEENFPTIEEGDVRMPELLTFGEKLTTPKALVKFQELGVRSATMRELVLFSARHPQEQTKHRIVALDVANALRLTKVYHLVPMLGGEGVPRCLSLRSTRELLGKNFRFAVVKI